MVAAVRACVGTFQLAPAPMKNPARVWKVSAAVARVSFSSSNVAGATLPSLATIGDPMNPALPPVGAMPFNSPMNRSGLREGTATPAPQRNAPAGVVNPSGAPRYSYPAYPDTSAIRAASLLTMKSPMTSAFPVLTPTVESPVGSLTMPRTATATGSCRDSDIRLAFTPR